MVDSDEIKKILLGIAFLFLIGFVLYGIHQHSTTFERDGFKVVEEHESYTLVEKVAINTSLRKWACITSVGTTSIIRIARARITIKTED